jgi:2-keto-4-pentenoate hydratase/2-oxohepta-3-ene-1,7-dioic acid hydratase in catechol pathway
LNYADHARETQANIPAEPIMTLLPGDIISTGTPAGVGLGMSPQIYLKDGDVVELGIDGLGTSKQQLTNYKYKSEM